MISKSLSRQNRSFEALYNYLTRDKESVLDSYNLYSDPYNRKSLIKEFLENADYLNRARGKNYFYHEILSLPKNRLSLKKQQQILKDLAQKYLLLRAQNHLSFTAMHQDKEHTHIHLMISANELTGTQRVRLSKKEFSTIQKEIESYKNAVYPELGETEHYQKGKSFGKSRNNEQERNNRTKEPSKKEILQKNLQEIFSQSHSKEELEKSAGNFGLEFYTRGKTPGVIFEEKKYRLKTLGVLENYETCINKQSQEQAKEQEQKKTAQSKENKAKMRVKREEMKKQRESREKER